MRSQFPCCPSAHLFSWCNDKRGALALLIVTLSLPGMSHAAAFPLPLLTLTPSVVALLNQTPPTREPARFAPVPQPTKPDPRLSSALSRLPLLGPSKRVRKALTGLAHLALSPLVIAHSLIQERLALTRIKTLEHQMTREETKLLAYQTHRFLIFDASLAPHFQAKPFYYANDRDRDDTLRREHHPRFMQWANAQDQLLTTRIRRAQWQPQAIVNPSIARKIASLQALGVNQSISLATYHRQHQQALRRAFDWHNTSSADLEKSLYPHATQFQQQLQQAVNPSFDAKFDAWPDAKSSDRSAWQTQSRVSRAAWHQFCISSSLSVSCT